MPLTTLVVTGILVVSNGANQDRTREVRSSSPVGHNLQELMEEIKLIELGIGTVKCFNRSCRPLKREEVDFKLGLLDFTLVSGPERTALFSVLSQVLLWEFLKEAQRNKET